MNPKELGRHVKKLRQELGLSQETLAEQASISRNYLSLIERGAARNISIGVLGQLAAVLGTSMAELAGEAGQSEILIPPALREFGIAEGLSFSVVDRLARIPRRGHEPQTVEEWRELYRVIRAYLEGND
jgi:transcriptional regulator with XRE-family HTH domain